MYKRARLPLVTELYKLGFTIEHIAERAAFPVVLQRWLEIDGTADPILQKLSSILAAWLRITELDEFVKGVELTMEMLRCTQIAPGQNGYLRLINAVFDRTDDATKVTCEQYRSTEYAVFLNDLQTGKRPIPESPELLRMTLLDMHVRVSRAGIAPIWPDDGSIEVIIDTALTTLLPKEAHALRLRFGIGGLEFTLAEIGKEFGVTQERVRQIVSKGLRKLRHPTRVAALKRISLPVGSALKRTLQEDRQREHVEILQAEREKKQIAEAEYLKMQVAERLPLLCESIEILDLSARSMNCLDFARIRFIGELIQRTEKETLEIKFLGRRSLAEIRAALAKHTLKFGTVFDEHLAKAFNAELVRRKTERDAY